MSFEGSAVHVYDTPAAYPVPAHPKAWGRMAFAAASVVGLAVVVALVLGIWSQLG